MLCAKRQKRFWPVHTQGTIRNCRRALPDKMFNTFLFSIPQHSRQGYNVRAQWAGCRVLARRADNINRVGSFGMGPVMGEFEDYVEILELAVQREYQANRFYATLAELTEDNDIRQILEELAQEELEHKARLELEIVKAGRVVTDPKDFKDLEPLDDDLAKPNIELDYRSVFAMGIEKEDASFRLYVDLLAYADDNESREVLLALAEEEVKHKLTLRNIYENLPKE